MCGSPPHKNKPIRNFTPRSQKKTFLPYLINSTENKSKANYGLSVSFDQVHTFTNKRANQKCVFTQWSSLRGPHLIEMLASQMQFNSFSSQKEMDVGLHHAYGPIVQSFTIIFSRRFLLHFLKLYPNTKYKYILTIKAN